MIIEAHSPLVDLRTAEVEHYRQCARRSRVWVGFLWLSVFILLGILAIGAITMRNQKEVIESLSKRLDVATEALNVADTQIERLGGALTYCNEVNEGYQDTIGRMAHEMLGD